MKLLDFGPAKMRTAEAVAGMTVLPTQTTPLTREGTILGTLQYMTPEQLEGLEADARTDIFALDAVIYEMAKGGRHFRHPLDSRVAEHIGFHRCCASGTRTPLHHLVPPGANAAYSALRLCLPVQTNTDQ